MNFSVKGRTHVIDQLNITVGLKNVLAKSILI